MGYICILFGTYFVVIPRYAIRFVLRLSYCYKSNRIARSNSDNKKEYF